MSTQHLEPASVTTAVQPPEPAEKTVWQYLWTGLSAGILALTLGLAALVIGLPAAVGGMPLTVLSASMEPAYSPGDLIVVKPTPAQDIQVGDVITYQVRSGDPTRITHRVIARSTTAFGTTSFRAQGDANAAPDDQLVTEVQVLGTLWYHLPGLGWITTVLTGTTRSWLIPVVAAGLFLYAAATLASFLRDRAKARQTAP
jgi:signal peptidase